MTRRRTAPGGYQFVTSCVDSTYEDIRALQDSEQSVALATFRRAIGPTQWREITSNLGYDRSFPITKDWAVSYHKGTYRGVPCYFVRHSRIFTLGGRVGRSLAGEDV